MMRLLLTILFFKTILLFGQSTDIDSLPIFYTIPTKELVFKKETRGFSYFQEKSNVNQSLLYNTDSIFVFSGNYGTIQIAFGKNNQYQTAAVRMNNIETEKFNVHFKFDSLRTNSLYLIATWYKSERHSMSTYSGNDELLCSQTQTSFSNQTTGIIVISLNAKTILYQGIQSEMHSVDERKYPGSSSSKRIEKRESEQLRFNTKGGYMNIIEPITSRNYPDTIPAGLYIIRDEKFVCVREG